MKHSRGFTVALDVDETFWMVESHSLMLASGKKVFRSVTFGVISTTE